MKKLRLDLDTLTVATFETAAAERGVGTVVAHGPKPKPSDATCFQYTCAADCSAPTFDWTCWETCRCPVQLETVDETCGETWNCPPQLETSAETCF